MAIEPQPTTGQKLSTLGRRAVGYAVIAVAAVLILKFAAGMVFGVLQTLFFVVALLAALVAIVWAFGQVKRDR